MSDASVRVEIDDGISVITLDDPDRLNALSTTMKRELLTGLKEVKASDVRCLVLQGAGKAFCAGGDIDRMKERMDRNEEGVPLAEVRASLSVTNEIITRIINFPAPVVTKVDGPAVGAGASLAIAGDVKLASERAKVGFVFRNVGLSIDGGASYLLTRQVGVDRAKELAFTGEIIDAERALDLGLVNHVFSEEEFDSEAEAFVERIASGPTAAFEQVKRLLNRAPEKPLDQALEDELIAQHFAINTNDHREGVRAFLEDREPEFEGH